MEDKINSFATSCFRVMLGVKRVDRVPNSEIYNRTNAKPLIQKVITRQLQFLGHILRLPDEEPAKCYALYTPPHGKRRPGRQRMSFLKYIQQRLGDYDDILKPEQMAKMAMDRLNWKKIVVACAAAER